jgi:hypothetical protein
LHKEEVEEEEEEEGSVMQVFLTRLFVFTVVKREGNSVKLVRNGGSMGDLWGIYDSSPQKKELYFYNTHLQEK